MMEQRLWLQKLIAAKMIINHVPVLIKTKHLGCFVVAFE